MCFFLRLAPHGPPPGDETNLTKVEEHSQMDSVADAFPAEATGFDSCGPLRGVDVLQIL